MRFFVLFVITIQLLFAVNHTIKEKNKENILSKKEFQLEEIKYKQQLKQQLKQYFHKNIVKNIYGQLNIKFYIDAKQGKIIYFIIYKREGDRKFIKFIKNKLKKIKKLKIFKDEKLIINPLIKIKLNIVFDTKLKLSKLDRLSLLKFNQDSNKQYYKYINYLIYKKKINKNKIKKILESKKTSFYKLMLYAIYFDYTKNNKNQAKKYYLKIINQNKLQLQEKEKLIISDWLIRNGYFKKVLKVFPDWSCTKYKNKIEQHQCYYYQAIAKYFLHKNCKVEMSIAQAYYSNKLNEGGIKWKSILK